MDYKKKLIEVALPLEAINTASAREKSIRHGHPSTLHLWWARRPLAACRAVIFASLVDDPSEHPEVYKDEREQEVERQRLFQIIERLVVWENSNNENVLNEARTEILKYTNGNPPPLLDPFAGGGSIPLEAQRLGLEAHAGDLNPVAVLINKALIEIPPRFTGRPPVNPVSRKKLGAGQSWKGAAGLAEDVRYYGEWMRAEAEKRIGYLYPKAKLKDGMEATVIAWIWARTVKCPNPACGAEMPLASSYWLSKKKYKEAWVEPIVNKASKTIRFTVKSGAGKPQEPKTARGARFTCPVCGTVTEDAYVKAEAMEGRMGARLMAIAADGTSGRVYLPPTEQHEMCAVVDTPSGILDEEMPQNPRWFSPPSFGLTKYRDLFTPRQLKALNTFSILLQEAKAKATTDAVAAGMTLDGVGLEVGGSGATAYGEAVTVYLAFVINKQSDYLTSICTWHNSGEKLGHTFARQAIPMTWDYAETNPLSNSSGCWTNHLEWVVKCTQNIMASASGYVRQRDASIMPIHNGLLVSTDPPYYDNIGYADLSDFFYVWQRINLRDIYPSLFRTLLVPKKEELIATPYRFNGNMDAAKKFFESGMLKVFTNIKASAAQEYPITVYYAFKQSESDEMMDLDDSLHASTGWETMLQALIASGFEITGTWPMRTEMSSRAVGMGTNALASSIVLVCRPRPDDAPITTRQDFQRELRRSIRKGLHDLQSGNIAPVDLAQASIGPGMAIFTKYKAVLESDGTPMRVRTALQIVNQELDAFLTEQEGELDAESRFCVAWFEQFGLNEGPFGEAQVLATAKAASMDELVRDGVLYRQFGKVRLLTRDEISEKWEAMKENTVWTVTQHLVKALELEGEIGTAKMLAEITPSMGENAKALAYRMFQLCERKSLASEALGYNALVLSWPEIQRKADAGKRATPVQTRMEGI